MKHFTAGDLSQLPRFERANLINSLSGIKPANLVGTVSKEGIPNLAIFSSVVHLGANPALMGFIQRPLTNRAGHSYRNILETGQFTLNHVHASLTEKAHFTSANFPAEISEFERVKLTPEFKYGFKAPFVVESQVRIGLKYKKSIPIELNGTTLVIGEIVHIELPGDALEEDGQVDLERAGSAGISGLNSYYQVKKIAEYPYAKVEEVPDFE